MSHPVNPPAYDGGAQRRCVACDDGFYLPPDEVEWYRERGLHLPNKCSRCRKAVKRAAAYRARSAGHGSED